MAVLNLLSSQTRVEVPFIKVTFGDASTENTYTFGIFQSENGVKRGPSGDYQFLNKRFPNYIQRLTVKKINGRVNQYSLDLTYPISEGTDPNFFEKVLSSVSKSRKILFSYGDMSMPTYIYKDEEALITKVSQTFSMVGSSISYKIEAVSSGILGQVGAFTFTGETIRPSEKIKELLYNSNYNLMEVFPGMRDKAKVDSLFSQLDDVEVKLQTKANISILDYINYLISCMQPVDGGSALYTMVIVDDVSGEYPGVYFKIIKVDANTDSTSTEYQIDIGFPSQNIVTDFQMQDNEQYSIFYDYSQKITNVDYKQKINSRGELEDVYAPIISSGNDTFMTKPEDVTWWKNVTQYPVKATITLKGLIRPSILMTHVRLNVYYYGRKHISSGLYVITGEQDVIDTTGFKTTLSLVRIKGDNSYTVKKTEVKPLPPVKETKYKLMPGK